MNLRDHILNVQDRKMEAVPVPEWGCTAYMRELSLPERLKLFDDLSDESEERNLYLLAILHTLCDADGNQLFNLEDYKSFERKNGDLMLRLGKQCAVFNRLLEDVVEQKKSN